MAVFKTSGVALAGRARGSNDASKYVDKPSPKDKRSQGFIQKGRKSLLGDPLDVLNHSGRYWTPGVNGMVPPETLTRYRSLFSGNPCLLGLEIINANSFYFCARSPGTSQIFEQEPPVIISLAHDSAARTLQVKAAADGEVLGTEHYRWFAEGRKVCEGSVLDYGKLEISLCYVRTEISSRGGTTYTNPFGFLLSRGF